MGTVGLVLGVSVLVLVVLGTFGYFLDAFRQDRIAKAMRECGIQAPAPAPVSPPLVSERDLPVVEECMVLGCSRPWTVIVHGWKSCTTHDHRTPHDQELDLELVSVEAEQWLRGIAS